MCPSWAGLPVAGFSNDETPEWRVPLLKNENGSVVTDSVQSPIARFMPTYDLLAAYCHTDYRVELADRHFSICPGEPSTDVDALLREVTEVLWAVITAENPRSRQVSDAENAAHRERLRQRLEQRGWQFFPTTAICPESSWPAEHGHLIVGPSVQEALTLAREFDQHAIVYGLIDQPVTLLFTDPVAWQSALQQGAESEDARVKMAVERVTQAEMS